MMVWNGWRKTDDDARVHSLVMTKERETTSSLIMLWSDDETGIVTPGSDKDTIGISISLFHPPHDPLGTPTKRQDRRMSRYWAIGILIFFIWVHMYHIWMHMKGHGRGGMHMDAYVIHMYSYEWHMDAYELGWWTHWSIWEHMKYIWTHMRAYVHICIWNVYEWPKCWRAGPHMGVFQTVLEERSKMV